MSDGAAKNYSEADMRQWVKTGEGHTAESFDSADGKTMMKLYFDFVPRASIEEELRRAEAVYAMGLPTPVPGELIRYGERYGCTFGRMAGKRSFSRAIADEPEKTEEYALRFVRMAKRLHSTPCDRSVFPSYKEKMATLLQKTGILSAEEKRKALGILERVEDADSCVHGDLHFGNVITDGSADMLIDLGDFAYGSPLFDLGSLYLLSYISSEDNLLRHYHLSRAQHQWAWKLVARAYFDANTEEELKEVEEKVRAYAFFDAMSKLERNPAQKDYPPFVHGFLSERE